MKKIIKHKAVGYRLVIRNEYYEGRKINFSEKGYAVVSFGEDSRFVHVLNWEKHFGKKPEGLLLHHKNQDRTNWDINNLELLTPTEHMRIHAGWIRKDGEWIKKPCSRCKKKLPLENFRKSKKGGYSGKCIRCIRKANKEKSEL